MTTLTILSMLAGTTLAGAVLGACAALAWDREHEPDAIARLTAANTFLVHEVEELERRAWRAEHVAAVFIGLRNAGSVIAIDRRGPA